MTEIVMGDDLTARVDQGPVESDRRPSERDARRIWRRVVTPEWTALLQQIGTAS